MRCNFLFGELYYKLKYMLQLNINFIKDKFWPQDDNVGKKIRHKIVFFLNLFVFGTILGNVLKTYHVYQQFTKIAGTTDSSPTAANYDNKYESFVFEVFGIIQKNYWDSVDENKLATLFQLALDKAKNSDNSSKIVDKNFTLADFKTNLHKAFNSTQNDEEKAKLSTNLVQLALTNLQPFGRNQLYSKKLKTDLQNTIQNINPNENRYQNLGVTKTASVEEITAKYEAKKAELMLSSTEGARQELAKVETAYQTLTNQEQRKIYDLSGVEPTLEYKLLTEQIFYLKIKQFSPTTAEELVKVTNKIKDRDEVNSLIIDLRGNIGGAIDGLPYFLGPFIGNNMYAYQFYQQGELEDFKTKVGFLPTINRFKKIVILIDELSQSSAEVMASVLKKYNVGVTLGKTTHGIGTIESVYNLKNQILDNEEFSVFLVHHLTVREDGQFIEAHGVEPDIFVSDTNWPKQIFEYFNDQALVDQIKLLYQ